MDLTINDIISDVHVYGLNESVHASGLPMQTKYKSYTDCMGNADIQAKNWKRAERLGNVDIGSGHDQYLSTIIVQFDLTIPVKMWTELQRYNFIQFCSSMSSIHCITKFDLDTQYDSHVDKRIIDIMKEKVARYNSLEDKSTDEAKELYLDILMSNPCGFNLTARLSTNYRQLKTIYYQRKDHRLPQWRLFCEWIESLPQFKRLCLTSK